MIVKVEGESYVNGVGIIKETYNIDVIEAATRKANEQHGYGFVSFVASKVQSVDNEQQTEQGGEDV